MKIFEPSVAAADVSASPHQQADAAQLATKTATLPRDAAKPRGWFWWACHCAFWLTAIVLSDIALARFVARDGTLLLTQINAFTRYLYLPAYICLAWGIWKQRWVLASVSLALVACHVTWMVPDFVRDTRFEAPSAAAANDATSPTVRIFFANILGTDHDFQPLWKEIEAANPDVVILAECTRASKNSLYESPVMQPYIRANERMKTQSGEVIVYSKLPVNHESQDWFAGRVVQSIDVPVGDKTLRIIGLHAPRPMPPPAYYYYEYWSHMMPRLAAEKEPFVAIGDFNATEHSLIYDQLKSSGMRSAHDDRGRGYATTWPRSRFFIPPIRIDHAFLSPDVECLDVREGVGTGSDHRPIIVDVRVRAPRPNQARVTEQPGSPAPL